ncbi:MAG: membrane protein insertase YidC [Bacteroidales bacterium]|nr:membrane protein insertase YidC [Bacteroidales bacterium]
MDKNSIFGIVLIAAILIVWGIINKPDPGEIEANRRRLDSLSMVEKRQQEIKSIQDSTVVAEQAELSGRGAIPNDSLKLQKLKNELGIFADNAVGENKFYTIENDLIRLIVSSKGGRPYSVELKKYKTFDQKPVVLFDGDSTKFGLTFYDQNKPISTNDLFFAPGDTLAHSAIAKGDSLIMRLTVSESRYIEYRYSLEPGSYMVGFAMQLSGMKDIVTRDPESIDMSWEIYVPQHEQLKKNENQYTSLYYRHYKEDVEYFNPRQSKDVAPKDIATQVEWFAFKSQFFSSVLIAETAFSNALLKLTNLPAEDKYLKNFRAEVGVPFQRLENETIRMKMFFGPNKFKLMKQYKDQKLDDLVSVGKGIIRWINVFVIIPIFDWLSKFMGNYGLIILLLTIIIKIGLLPLTYKSYLSQASMKALKPQIDELTKKYPKGKELEKQQATMALYKKAGVSPMGGCLPMLLQFPILFAMFRFFPTSIELRQEGFLWVNDLSTFDSIYSWDAIIPILSNIYGNHISLFTILMTVSTIIQMKMSDSTMSSQQMPGMKSMMYIMPVMFMFVLNNFSSGLTYYYFLTNMITIGQNYLFKQFVDEKELLRKIEEKKTKPVKKSKWQQRLDEMAKQAGQKPAKRK